MQLYACAHMKEWRLKKTVPDKTKKSICYSHEDNTDTLTYARAILLNEN